MNKKFLIIVMILMLTAIIFSGCSNTDKMNPADAAYTYLEALAKKDKTQVINSSCKAWEEQASLEVDALLSVGANLNKVQCEVTGSDSEFQFVKCSGTLDLTYNDEVRAIDLSQRTYSMTLEDGQWRVCAYK